jgi:hypothetical protein
LDTPGTFEPTELNFEDWLSLVELFGELLDWMLLVGDTFELSMDKF